MTRRYVFWRTPEGFPYRKDDNKFAHEEHLKAYGESASINVEGRVKFDGFWLPNPMLHASVVILDATNCELNPTDTKTIVKSSLSSLVKKKGGKKPILASEFIETANELAAEFYRKPRQGFVLVGSLSTRRIPSKRILIRGCLIRPLASRRRYPYPGWLEKKTIGTPFERHLKYSQYQLIRVDTIGRSEHEAAELGMECIAVLCGLWSLIATYRRKTFQFGGFRPKPVGPFVPGPFYTLHKENGKLALDNYWFEPSYFGDQTPFDSNEHWGEIESQRKRLCRSIAKSPFKQDIELLVARYSSALSQHDHDLAFLKLWSILERITGTIGKQYDETIKRATWICTEKSRKAAREIMMALRLIRNRFIHSAISGDHRELIAQAAKDFVDMHLLKLFANDAKVSTLDEYARLLGLPCDHNELVWLRRYAGIALRAETDATRSSI